jgi:hypothetical protein
VLNLKIIARDGVLIRDLNDVVWEVAKQNNIVAKLDLRTFSLLTVIYDNQRRIMKSEDEISKCWNHGNRANRKISERPSFLSKKIILAGPLTGRLAY